MNNQHTNESKPSQDNSIMKRSIKFAALFLVGLTLQSSFVERTSAAEIEELVTIEGITQFQLDNGLKILLYPDNSAPTVTVNLTVFVGSRHEGYGETGMAHLLELMVFKGTPTHGDIPGLLTE
jgi:zinc protease